MDSTHSTLLHRLLDATTWRAFDLDVEGRILAGHDDSGTVQLVELRPGSGQHADGGTRAPLTALPGAVHGRYLIGSRRIVVSHDAGGNERAQLSLLDPDSVDEPVGEDGLTPLVHDPAYIHALVDVLADGRIAYATNRRNGVDFDLVVRDLDDGTEAVLYDGGGMVGAAAVAPDGTRALMTRPGRPALSSQVLLLGGGTVTELTDADEHARHLDPQWLPDGDAAIVTTDSGRDHLGVARLDVATGKLTWLVTDDAHDVTARLSPDGRSMLVVTDDDGASRLAVHDADGTFRREVTLPAGYLGGVADFLAVPRWSPDGTGLALSWSDPATPADVLLIDAARGRAATIATSRDQLAATLPPGLDLVGPTSHGVPTPDGETVPCFVYTPAHPSGSSVVIVHGGPEGQSVRSFSAIVQALVGEGHTVLVPNVRGSVGYGKRWYSLDDVELRLDSVADLAALHAYLPRLGLDPARAALWGGSYGGYMVLAGLAFQPELWAAGVDIVGISSLVTFLENTSPYRRAHREREYGSLERDREFLERASPLHRIGEVRAPLFVIHGANDPRVPLSEAEQVAAAVRANGVEVEMVVYDDEGHGLAKRVNRLDAYPRAVAFLGRALARS
ncbi:alpha/beta hydrolase family protein [Actinomycetospora cinnamomea]|uniref:Dipeptidyl aminopeptidase/acylaminoacyl peptidase n=1 Tax=Actinomycetospora cinnamomea TaxID=663609 RepID=A0A2U1FB75_9PSEU|nr:S9 family peptidase [Actinomycetospora cinnamomea]PVZ09432.1 dipeptidyl aminopeptidase/acylaminoacyl peptidase [Actinomycetospora cinnamomea]